MTLEPLVVAAAGGDVDAFGRLVPATSAVVSSIALAIVRNLDLSKDMSQAAGANARRSYRLVRGALDQVGAHVMAGVRDYAFALSASPRRSTLI